MDEKIMRMYASGMTCQQISNEIGMPMTTVWYRLKKHGVQMLSKAKRTKGKPNLNERKFDRSEVKKMYSSGMTSSDISKSLGVSSTAIIRALKNEGVTLREGWESKSIKSLGNVSISSHGYKRIATGKKQRQYEHILIAEKALGRHLRDGEVVHHINCNKQDNRPENLLICTHEYHLQLHARMRRHQYWKTCHFKGD